MDKTDPDVRAGLFALNYSITVDIIIVNLNGKNFLEKCLPSIYASTDGVLFKIVIIDNGSTDGSDEWVESEYPEIIWIQNEVNTGFSRACNQGIKRTNGQYILFLNNDTELLNNLVWKLKSFLESNRNAGVVGPRILYPDRSIQASIKYYPPVWKFALQQLGIASLLLPKKKLYFPFGPFNQSDYQTTHTVDWLSGACMMFKRTLADSIGLLDEQMPFGVDDLDFCKRAELAGYKNYYIHDAELIHNKGGSHDRGSYLTQNPYVLSAYKQGIKEYFRKYHSVAGYGIVKLSMFFGDLLRKAGRFGYRLIRVQNARE